MHFSPLRRDSLYGTLRHWAMMDLPSIEDTANNFAIENALLALSGGLHPLQTIAILWQ